jgi:hypothetical protein
MIDPPGERHAMRVLEVAKILGLGLLFRALPLEAAGRQLLLELRSDDETARMLAGTMLMRAGSRARATLRAAACAEQSLPMVLPMLGDLGDPSDAGLLRRFLGHHDPQVKLAAKDALEVLSARGQT